jgi:hypothetical protein
MDDRSSVERSVSAYGLTAPPSGLTPLLSGRPAEPTMPSANQIIHDARRSSRSPLTLPKPVRQTSTSSGLRTLFSRLFRRGSGNTPPPNPNINNRRPPSPRDNVRRNTQGFRKTENLMPAEGPGAGPACRIYGSVGVKRVTGNLHVTTLGHGYMSWEHTGHHRKSNNRVFCSCQMSSAKEKAQLRRVLQ